MWPETHLSRNLKIILSFSLIIINVAQIFSWFTETLFKFQFYIAQYGALVHIFGDIIWGKFSACTLL